MVVANSAGSITSAAATLTVLPAPEGPVITTSPERVRALAGQTASFTVQAQSKTPMTYQWQKGKIIGNMADIPGATGAAYQTPATTLADNHTLFRCVVTNPAGNATSASEILFVTDPNAKSGAAAKP